MVDLKTALVAGIVLVVALSLSEASPLWTDYLATVTSAWQSQGIYGTVSSGRVVFGGCGPADAADLAAHPPVSEHIVVRSSGGIVIDVPLNRTVAECELLGTYRVGLKAGNYSVDILSCTLQPHQQWGCATVVPVNVTVRQGVFKKVDIHMYTGIV